MSGIQSVSKHFQYESMKPSETLRLRVLVPLYLWLMQAGKGVVRICTPDLMDSQDREGCGQKPADVLFSRDVWDLISLLQDLQGHSD